MKFEDSMRRLGSRRRRVAVSSAAALLIGGALATVGCGGGMSDDGPVHDGDAAEVAQTEQAVDINPCACLDGGQIEDCRSGTCYSFCASKRRNEYFWCNGYPHTCPVLVRYPSYTVPPMECLY